jgi:hypothetical protein
MTLSAAPQGKREIKILKVVGEIKRGRLLIIFISDWSTYTFTYLQWNHFKVHWEKKMAMALTMVSDRGHRHPFSFWTWCFRVKKLMFVSAEYIAYWRTESPCLNWRCGASFKKSAKSKLTLLYISICTERKRKKHFFHENCMFKLKI